MASKREALNEAAVKMT
uniref:Uncharacterized protein n=1 Tax=Rhizophora mucronata TaxID=61149 RepID=A0A2P2NV10_RHIMU